VTKLLASGAEIAGDNSGAFDRKYSGITRDISAAPMHILAKINCCEDALWSAFMTLGQRLLGMPHEASSAVRAIFEKLRTLGTGPAYRTLNGRVYYTGPDMTQDIEERLSPPRRSSSEPDQTPTAEPMPANHRSRHGRLEAAEASPAG
jgi:hypothetical protein